MAVRNSSTSRGITAPRAFEAYLKGLPFLGALDCSQARVTAGATVELVLTYTVGAAGLADGGRLKITFRFYSDWQDFQTTRPDQSGYASAQLLLRASFPGESSATARRLAVKFDPKGHERPYQKTLLVDVVDGYLRPGDRIKILLGDRSKGGPGARAQTFAENRFRFRAYVDPVGTSRLAAVPGDAVLAVIPAAPLSLKVISPRLVRPGTAFPFVARVDDAWGNPAPLENAQIRWSLEREGAVAAKGGGAWNEGARAFRDVLTAPSAGDYRLRVRVAGPGHWEFSAPLSAGELPSGPRAFFADLHVHSHDTVGTNSTESNLAFARDLAGLDVLGYTVNDFQVTDRDWAASVRACARVHEEGRFVCFPGTEWCGNSAVGGDHNVVFLGAEARFPRDMKGGSLRSFEWHEHLKSARPQPGLWPVTELYRAYEDRPEDFLLIPHVGGRRAVLDWHHPRLERLVELASSWGHFDWLYQEALARGYRLGASAAGDEHQGRPGGGAPGASLFGVAGGLTGVLSPALNRADVARALRARHTWATTGERNAALLSASGRVQGDAFHAGETVNAEYRLYGNAGWEYVALRDHQGPVWERHLHREQGYSLRRVRLRWGGARTPDRYRWAEWELELRVEGSGISLFHSQGGPREGAWRFGPRRFKALSRTHGDADTLEFQVDALKDAVFHIQVSLRSFDGVRDAPLQWTVRGKEVLTQGSVERDLGGAGLFLALERVSEGRLPLRLEGRISLPVKATPLGAYPLYLFARERDGAKVWTSPLFLLRDKRSRP